MPLSPKLAALLTASAVLVATSLARADNTLDIEQSTIDYTTGRYEACALRLGGVLKSNDPTDVLTQELRSQARMYMAACLMALKREGEADTQLEQLIREDHKFAPDRASFTRPVIARFLDTQLKLRDEIQQKIRIEQEREAELKRRREERERLERERQAEVERMAREQINIQRNSRLIALLPGGIGQFQNRQRGLGWTLLGAQAVFAASSVVSYYLKQDIERQFSTSVNASEALRLRNLAVQVNYLSFGALVLTALGGVVHAQVTFVPEFRELRERNLPPPVPGLPVGGTLLWQGRW